MSVEPKDTSKKHFYISLAKSVIRIGAGGFFVYGNVALGGLLIILAEILGIAEEL